MKIKSNITKVVMLITMLLASLSAMAYDFEVDGVYYNIISMDDMTCQIDGGRSDLTDLNLSGTVDFKGRQFTVEGMKTEAFAESNIVNLTIDGNLEVIPSKAFYSCKQLISVSLKSVKTIEDYAFDECTRLSDLNLGIVEEIGKYAFAGSVFPNLEIPGTVNHIGSCGVNFERCDEVRFLSGNTLLSLSGECFKDGAKIFLDRNITGLTHNLYGWYRNGEEYSYNQFIEIEFGDNVTIFPSNLGGRIEKIDLSKTNIRVIDKYAFCYGHEYSNGSYDESDLSEIILPMALDSIKSEAFYGAKINDIKLPDGLSYIGDKAFSNCDSLTAIEIPGSVKIINSLFGKKPKIESVKLNEGTEVIGKEAFKYAPLESIVFPGTVSAIGENAFYGCDKLTKLTIPSNINLIEGGAFNKCSGLRSLEIEEGDNPLYAKQELINQKIRNGKEVDNEKDAYEYPNPETVYSEYLSPFIVDSLTDLKVNRPVLCFEYPDEDSSSGQIDESSIKKYHVVRTTDVYSFIFPNTTLKKLNIGDFKYDKCFFRPDTIEYQYTDYEIYSIHEEGTYKKIMYEKKYYLSPVFYPESLSSLQELYINMTTPPELTIDFPNSVYMNAVLYVPIGAKATYEQAPYWKNFWEIVETNDFSGVEEMPVNTTMKRTVVGRYDITGKSVSENHKGITIIRFSDGSTKKMVL